MILSELLCIYLYFQQPQYRIPFFKKNIYLFIFILCALVFCLHICLHEDVRLPEGIITDSPKLPCECWELKLGPLEKQQCSQVLRHLSSPIEFF